MHRPALRCVAVRCERGFRHDGSGAWFTSGVPGILFSGDRQRFNLECPTQTR